MIKYQILCNKCETDLSGEIEYFSHQGNLGYGSIADGADLRIDLCNNCLLEIIKTFRIDPIQ